MSAVPQPTDMIQRTVPAAKAPPPDTRAPSSVFDLGGSGSGSLTSQRRRVIASSPAIGGATRRAPGVRPRTERAIDLLRERGPLTAAKVGEALDCSPDAASIMLCGLKNRGVGVVGKDGRRALYGMAGAAAPAAVSHKASDTDPWVAATLAQTPQVTDSGTATSCFKHWLSKKSEASAEGRPAAGKAAKSSPTLADAAPAQQSEPAAAADPCEPELACGLFNNGDLVLEAGEQRLRLSKAQTRQLVAYLDLVSTAALGLGQA